MVAASKIHKRLLLYSHRKTQRVGYRNRFPTIFNIPVKRLLIRDEEFALGVVICVKTLTPVIGKTTFKSPLWIGSYRKSHCRAHRLSDGKIKVADPPGANVFAKDGEAGFAIEEATLVARPGRG